MRCNYIWTFVSHECDIEQEGRYWRYIRGPGKWCPVVVKDDLAVATAYFNESLDRLTNQPERLRNESNLQVLNIQMLPNFNSTFVWLERMCTTTKELSSGYRVI